MDVGIFGEDLSAASGCGAVGLCGGEVEEAGGEECAGDGDGSKESLEHERSFLRGGVKATGGSLLERWPVRQALI